MADLLEIAFFRQTCALVKCLLAYTTKESSYNLSKSFSECPHACCGFINMLTSKYRCIHITQQGWTERQEPM